jgi:hypothetical protein
MLCERLRCDAWPPQADFACKTCKVCGMTYAPGAAEDERLHAAHHQTLVQGIRFQARAA